MRYALLLVVFLALVGAGCSGGGNAVLPGSGEQAKSTPSSLDTVPVLGLEVADDGSFNAVGLLGAYELQINPENSSAELVSMRLPSLGQSWIVSGMAFFTIAPCHTCLRISSVGLTTDGNLVLKFAIKHPFAPGVTTLPPSAVNRLDLDIFDVAMVVVPTGATSTNFALIGKKAYTGLMVGNPGYTTELAGLVTDTAAMPYVLVIDDSLGTTSTFNKFAMGAEKTFDAVFDTAGLTSFNFTLYLTMGYGASAQGKDMRLTPKYFNPEFNRKASWKVKVTPPQGANPPAMGNTWQDNDPNLIYNVKVEVYDWQQGVTTIANPPVNTGDIAFASNVASVSVEIPGMTSTLPSVTTPASGTGTPASPLVFQVPVKNQNLLAPGEYLGLVKVADSRLPETTPTAIDFLIHTPDGIALANYAIPEFATYQTFIATVVVGNLDPIASAVATTPTSIMDGQAVTFNASTSHDPDGTITLYEWDFNEDGTFAGTGDSYTGTVTNPTHIFPIGDGSISVQLRVTDNGLATDTLDTPITVTVAPSKNITLREGIRICDIATIEGTNEVLVLFEDKLVYKYDSTLGDERLLIKFDDQGIPYADPWNGRIDASRDGFSHLTGFPYQWGYGTLMNTYDPDGNDISGLWGGWGEDSKLRAESFHSRNSNNPESLGALCMYPGVWGWTVDWWFQQPDYSGIANAFIISFGFDGPGNINAITMKGAHCCYDESDNEAFLFILEGDPDYTVERGTMEGGNFDPGRAWGKKADDDTGFYNPQDITIDNKDKVYIPDITSTGNRKIKMFTLKGDSLGSFGNNTSMGSDPERIEASWGNNYIYVSMNDKISIFFPTEHP